MCANQKGGIESVSVQKINSAERELRASELSYRRLFEAAKDGILILDFNTGRISDVNPFLADLLGFPRGEMIGRTVGELSPFKDVISNQAMLERLQKDGYVRYENLPLEARDGRKVAVEFVSNVYDAGESKVIQCNIRDITERRKVEQSLRLLQSAVEQTQESIMITDAQLGSPGPMIVFVNPAFTRMTGYSASEVIGKSPRILQGPRTDKTVLARLRQNLERGEIFSGEAINYRKDGTEFDLEWQISPLRDDGGRITHFVATQQDVTERRKLEAQFRQAQKMEAIGQLAGGVAHEFNNILAAIQMQAELLRGESLTDLQSEVIDEISASVRRAATLTRQLLLFSRREIFRPGNLDLSESITHTSKMLARILGENVEIQLKLAAQPLFIHADAGMIDQVLLNLAVNARDAMPSGGRLIIKTAGVDLDDSITSQAIHGRPGSFVCLSVTDTGCGIPPGILPKIFDPFFTTKDVGKGSGLGLATVFGIVEQHQGWVNVSSQVGQGTTFQIFFPRAADLAFSRNPPAELDAVRGGSETILLVEDDSSLRASVHAVLSRLGYQVLAARSGVNALEIWGQYQDRIDLLLTDLMMPDGVSGIQLADQLLLENPRLKVIYMSGYSPEVFGGRLPLKEGANFLPKPFPSRQLAIAIRQSLDAGA